MPPRKINQKQYAYYLFDKLAKKIIEGFEYAQDAKDRKKEMTDQSTTPLALAVYSKSYLVRNDSDPDQNSSWKKA
jgi:hypothetical protein